MLCQSPVLLLQLERGYRSVTTSEFQEASSLARLMSNSALQSAQRVTMWKLAKLQPKMCLWLPVFLISQVFARSELCHQVSFVNFCCTRTWHFQMSSLSLSCSSCGRYGKHHTVHGLVQHSRAYLYFSSIVKRGMHVIVTNSHVHQRQNPINFHQSSLMTTPRPLPLLQT